MVDTLALYQILKRGSFSEQQARAVTDAVQRAEIHFATDVNSEIGRLETVLNSWRAELRAEFRTEIKTALDQQWSLASQTFATKADLSRDLGQLEGRLTRWMFGFWVGQVAVMVGIVFAALKLFR